MKLADIKSCAECPLEATGLCHPVINRICDNLYPETDLDKWINDALHNYDRAYQLYGDIND